MSDKPLSIADLDLLKKHEAIIEKGVKTFEEVGKSLALIRDRKLYCQDYASFDEYCEKRWGFEKRRANQLIQGAKVIETIKAKVGTTVPKPTSERQTRELSRLPEDEVAEAWSEAVETAPDNQPTAKHVADVVAARQQPNADQPKDEVGNVIPAKLHSTFASRGRFKDILNLLTNLSAMLNALHGDQAGTIAPTSGGERLGDNRQQIQADIKNLRAAVKFAAPYAVCPYPHGKSKCSGCGGLGWVTKEQYDRAPSEMRKAGAA